LSDVSKLTTTFTDDHIQPGRASSETAPGRPGRSPLWSRTITASTARRNRSRQAAGAAGQVFRQQHQAQAWLDELGGLAH
jgi:hypothetical protein